MTESVVLPPCSGESARRLSAAGITQPTLGFLKRGWPQMPPLWGHFLLFTISKVSNIDERAVQSLRHAGQDACLKAQHHR
jgi:hypothetical protein